MAARGLQGANPQVLSNTAWAYASAGHPAPALLEAIAKAATAGGLGHFTDQALGNTVWAYAKLGQAVRVRP